MKPVAEGYKHVIKPSIFSRDMASFNDTSKQFSRLTSSVSTTYFRILTTDSSRRPIIEILYYNPSLNDFQNLSVKFVCKFDCKRTIYNIYLQRNNIMARSRKHFCSGNATIRSVCTVKLYITVNTVTVVLHNNAFMAKLLPAQQQIVLGYSSGVRDICIRF